MNIIKSLQSFALICSLVASQAYASVVISGTRVIFPGNEREVTIKLTNEGKLPALVQAWIDTGDQNAAPETINVPFTLTPAMFRIEPNKGQTLRMIYTNEPLPTDKESLFWLNVLEIPPKAADSADRNQLQIAFRSRLKIMFRPEGLKGESHKAPAQLRWQIVRGAQDTYVLKATNPTPYVVNLGSILLHAGEHRYDAGAGYVLPGSTREFPVATLKSLPAPGAKVQYGSINDWGTSSNNEQPVSMQP
ncbi:MULTISPECIES: fimbria/pilus periplasmic chaperone [unclassified Burkholderia]|uniref:fimbrial biogenesis chaperone n=1 Tax=unclassified Burkholderia TaxID=2613784 RepID=UPI0014236A5C|nr:MULTISPECIES: fimbria/pilus periplasmic chaperone [unclassified Burkholderia]NIE56320.1 fimbria/pilus periplasmic chaperone [Burkholderia sp. Ap-955]NIF08325.1 fimbria/pilus periplasmic chaperone [Burkholderia sp. Ax-1735]NIG00979.1 fimbria/pilus periplasmic chaperone [Burkholderia sp. Tr-849]